ncbi:MAG: zincin-like metallopeptidase domain-containing protein [Melioribacteraceae bacterium]
MNRNELFGKINTQILEKLKEGVIPWKRTWKEGVPANFISKRRYHGINFLSLSLNDFPNPYYLTFNQCKERGGSVLTGSKSQMIVYWKVLEYKNEERDEDLERYPMIRYSNVFNLSQTSLSKENDEAPRIIECEQVIENMKDKPVIKYNINRCYYNPKKDYISLPKMVDFNSPEEYYATLFHELIHWSGHSQRLNRESLTVNDKEKYSFEELLSEIGASYVSALCGISPKVIDNSASYIDGWIRLSEKQENLFPLAAAQASKAVNYILGDLTNYNVN